MPHLTPIIWFGSLTTVILLSLTLFFKMEKIKRLQLTADNLKKTLEEMDDQAKLLVSTDMELNKIQEELDKKITGLYALQKLSRAMSTTLEESQIFQNIEPNHLQELGFEKTLVFLWDEQKGKFSLSLNIGYLEDEIEEILVSLQKDKNTWLDLIKNKKSFSSLSLSNDTLVKEKLASIFKVASFALAPILPKEGSQGIFFIGTENADFNLNAGDEELIAILVNQIGQTLENARLFEKTWTAHQELERKVAERTRELTLALEEVKNINKRKSDFVSSVTHELRTPLTSIKGYASILLSSKQWAMPEEMRKRLEKINQHSDELAHFVNDLLDISRIESGRVVMKPQSVELKPLVEEVYDLLMLLLKEKRIDFSVQIADNAAVIFADRDQIKRVLINLINNALKFTPAGGKISLNTHPNHGQIQVDVNDSGCGIPEEVQGKIFEEFYRVDNPINQQVKGSGLGLTLVKNIIEAHKGEIWVKSKVGSGTTFSFTLPTPD